jgi:hypothetical protein
MVSVNLNDDDDNGGGGASASGAGAIGPGASAIQDGSDNKDSGIGTTPTHVGMASRLSQVVGKASKEAIELTSSEFAYLHQLFRPKPYYSKST